MGRSMRRAREGRVEVEVVAEGTRETALHSSEGPLPIELPPKFNSSTRKYVQEIALVKKAAY
jgi:hypothetical protein